MRQLLIAALCLVGCSNSGSLIFVTVDSVAHVASATRLHVILVNGTAMRSKDLTLSPASFPPSHSFAVDINPGVSGNMSITVEAFDSAGASVGSASGSVAIVAGRRVDLALTLGAGAPADLGMPPDLSGVDAGTPVDLTVPAPDSGYRALTWAPQNLTATDGTVIWASDANHIWIGAENMNNNLFSTGNDVWVQTATLPSFQSSGLWGPDAKNVFLVDTSGYIRAWDPTTTNWSTDAIYQVDSNHRPFLLGIWGTSLNDIYVVGRSNGANPTEYIYHNTTGNIASGWTDEWDLSDAGLNAISGVAGHIYSVGPAGRILYKGSSGFSPVNSPVNTNLLGVFVLDAKHVYVVGDSGTVLFSSGGAFTQQTLPPGYAKYAFRAVWAAGPDDVFAVGDNGTVLHGDSTGTWVAQTSGLEGLNADLKSVWGTSARNVYVTGSNWVSHGQ